MKINRLVNFSIIGLAVIGLALPQISLAVTQCGGLGASEGFKTQCRPSCGGMHPKEFPAGNGGCAQSSTVNIKCCGQKIETTTATTNNNVDGNTKIRSLIKSTPSDFIARIIKNLLGLAGTMTMVMMVYGGLLWMTARGNQKAIGQAQRIIIWTAVGLIIIFSSYTILSFLFNNLK